MIPVHLQLKQTLCCIAAVLSVRLSARTVSFQENISYCKPPVFINNSVTYFNCSMKVEQRGSQLENVKAIENLLIITFAKYGLNQKVRTPVSLLLPICLQLSLLPT